MTGFHGFLKRIKITLDSTDYYVPVWDLDVRATPWSGTGSIFTKLFDGRKKAKTNGWRTRASIDLNFKTDAVDNVTWLTFLNAIATGTAFAADFDPDEAPGTKVLTLIAENAESAARAVFNGRVRNRPARIDFISPTVSATKPGWLSSSGMYDCAETEHTGGPTPSPETLEYPIGESAGWIEVEYDVFAAEDGIELLYDGVVVADTGGLVTGTGSLFWEYPGYTGTEPRVIQVRVTAGAGPATEWTYTVKCPDPANAPA